MLLSLTIATYNASAYIEETIESLLCQTFSDFEIICIDDASTDNTVEILKSFEKKDKRIRLILKDKNEGLAVARNQCLEEAKGKYITFLDGDDLYDRSLFEKAITLAENNNSDLVIWDHVTFYNKNEIEILKEKESELNYLSIEDKYALLRRPAFTWVKLIRTDKARNLQINFPAGLTKQDIPVHWHLLTKIDKINLLPERLSFYRQHAGATTARKDEKLFDVVYIMDIVENYLHQNKLYSIYSQVFLEQKLNLFASMYDNVKPELKKKALSLILERIPTEINVTLSKKNNLRKHTVYFFSSLQGSTMAKIKLKAWHLSRFLYRKLRK